MVEEYSAPTGYTGSLTETSETRKELAQQSGSYNIKKFPKFNELFPGIFPSYFWFNVLRDFFVENTYNKDHSLKYIFYDS